MPDGNPMPTPQAVKPYAEPGARCGARTRKGTPCGQAAGHRTPHPGEGRCYLHGGLTPIRSGRYSSVTHERLRELIATFEADPDPLNMLADLAAGRALFVDYIERYDEWRSAFLAWHESFRDPEKSSYAKPMKVMDLADAGGLLAEVTKIVERIEKVRAANAISRADMNRVLSEMGRVVDLHVEDGATKQRIKEGWLAIRL